MRICSDESIKTRGIPIVFRRFIRREDGVVAVEMGFVTIFFVTLITGLISFGSLYFVKGNMSDAARDTARRIALGELSPADAPAHALGKLINWGMTYTVTATNDGTDAVVSISVPMGEAGLIDFLGLFGGTLSSSVTMPVES